MGTKIILRFGEATISAELNANETARAFAEKLHAQSGIYGLAVGEV